MHADPSKPFYSIIYRKPLGPCHQDSTPVALFKQFYKKLYKAADKLIDALY